MDLPRHTLFVALTRPALNRWGVPHKLAVVLLMLTQLFALIAGRGQFYYYLAGLPLFLAARALTEWDHNFFSLFMLWRKTKAGGLGWWLYWGGAMLTPIPQGDPDDPEDLAGGI